MLSKIVELAGHDPITTLSGREAIDLAVERRPDLIILDMNMPDLSGLEVIEALRERAETQDIPALILSAGSEAESIARVLAVGGQGYLEKPLSMDKLLEVISSYSEKNGEQ
jgi:DNA-binding response OmpR family regulator